MRTFSVYLDLGWYQPQTDRGSVIEFAFKPKLGGYSFSTNEIVLLDPIKMQAYVVLNLNQPKNCFILQFRQYWLLKKHLLMISFRNITLIIEFSSPKSLTSHKW